MATIVSEEEKEQTSSVSQSDSVADNEMVLPDFISEQITNIVERVNTR